MSGAPEPSAAAAPRPPRACSICGKPADAGLTPFCSKRCADVDLHRWLGGVYAVPASEHDDDEAADDEP